MADTDDKELDALRWPTRPKTPYTIEDMNQPIDWDISPVCTYCLWHEPEDGRFCAAFPDSERIPIPEQIWKGDVATRSHMYPVGTEQKDDQGNPIVFALHPETRRRGMPKQLKHDLAEREAQTK
jgi:hypothetical protein